MTKWVLALALLGVGAGIIVYLARSPRATHAPSPASRPLAESAAPAPATPAEAPIASPQVPTQAVAAAPAAEETASPPQPGPPIASNSSADTPTPQDSTVINIGQPKLAPEIVLENMRNTIRDFGSRFGGNPVGNNAEITASLNGANPKQVVFIKPDSGLRINGKGELIDAWGTPFFFHQLSRIETEVRSAGPDRVMWTADDLISK